MISDFRPPEALQDSHFLIIGRGPVYLCELMITAASLPEPLDVQNFFAQVSVEGMSRRSPDVVSREPLRLLAGGELPDGHVHIKVVPKSPLAPPRPEMEGQTFETALSLKHVFSQLSFGERAEVELALVPAGSHVGLAAISRYCMTVSERNDGAYPMRLRVLCSINGRQAAPSGQGACSKDSHMDGDGNGFSNGSAHRREASSGRTRASEGETRDDCEEEAARIRRDLRLRRSGAAARSPTAPEEPPPARQRPRAADAGAGASGPQSHWPRSAWNGEPVTKEALRSTAASFRPDQS